MAVYKRGYRAYTGPLTAPRSRFLILARYALLDVFESRLLVSFFVLCFVPFLVESTWIYVCHNPTAVALLGLQDVPMAPSPAMVNAAFFLRCVRIQGFLAFILAAWVGPGLVAPDLANGALPLYLSRPFSRAEYVAGKLTLLVGLLSVITWVPNLLLYFLKAGLADGWLGANLRIGGAILGGSLLWVALISLFALALSASVKRRIAASLLMCGLFFVGAPFGEIWRNVVGNSWGRLANLGYLIGVIWQDLFGVVPEMMRERGRIIEDVPVAAAWVALVLVCALSLWLLDRRVRAREIVS